MKYWFLCWTLIGVFLFCFIIVYEAFQLKFRVDREGESAFDEVEAYQKQRGVNEWSLVKCLTWFVGVVLIWPVPLFFWFRAAYTHGSLGAKQIHKRPVQKVDQGSQSSPPRITLTKKTDDVVDVFRDMFS